MSNVEKRTALLSKVEINRNSRQSKQQKIYYFKTKKPNSIHRYHPFYISDSQEGGFGQRTVEEQRSQKVYAGIEYDSEDYPFPTGAGRYCEWEHRTVDKSADIETFEDYMQTLHLECEEGNPGVLNWTVPMDAPDLLYYQCFTHNNLGWKIHVVDPGQVPLHGNEISVASDLHARGLLVALVAAIVIRSFNTISGSRHIID